MVHYISNNTSVCKSVCKAFNIFYTMLQSHCFVVVRIGLLRGSNNIHNKPGHCYRNIFLNSSNNI